MSIAESIQDFIGKYSVTGVLRERLELEANQSAALREQLVQKDILLAQKDVTIANLTSENDILNTKLQNAQDEIDALKRAALPPPPFKPEFVNVRGSF